jgi:hypothetical protein
MAGPSSCGTQYGRYLGLSHACPCWPAAPLCGCRVPPLQDPNVPIKWLNELFDKYVPGCTKEMQREYNHITPLGAFCNGQGLRWEGGPGKTLIASAQGQAAPLLAN